MKRTTVLQIVPKCPKYEIKLPSGVVGPPGVNGAPRSSRLNSRLNDDTIVLTRGIDPVAILAKLFVEPLRFEYDRPVVKWMPLIASSLACKKDTNVILSDTHKIWMTMKKCNARRAEVSISDIKATILC